MRRLWEQVITLFFDGIKESMEKMPIWVKILVPLLWFLLYLTLIFVVGYLSIAYQNIVLGILDIGFVLIVLSVIFAAIRYHYHNKK